MRAFIKSGLGLFAAASLCGCAIAQTSGASAGTVAAKPWDLAAERSKEVAELYTFMQKTHPALYKVTAKGDYDVAAEALRQKAPALDWPHYVMGVYSLLSLSGDGHTSMYPLPDQGPGFDTRYPVLTETFSDGVYVVAADPRHAALVGKKLVSIDGHSVREIGLKLSTYWPHNNVMWVERWLPTMLRRPGYLSGTDLVKDVSGPATFAVIGTDGKTIKASVRPVPVKDDETAQKGWTRARSPQAPKPTPIHEDGKPFGVAVLNGGKVVYAAYRQSGDGDDEKVEDFTRRLFAAVADPRVEKLILDIRENGGGDNSYNFPVQLGIVQARNVNQPGRLYVITGRETFSAGQNIATFLERYSEAAFVGEPAGSSPNHFGDLVQFETPVSKLSVIMSTVPWQDSSPHDQRKWILPDIAAKPTFADYVAGRDPALNAALDDTKGREATRPGESWKRASQSGSWEPAWNK